jgi:hypothetical protein
MADGRWPNVDLFKIGKLCPEHGLGWDETTIDERETLQAFMLHLLNTLAECSAIESQGFQVRKEFNSFE